MFAILDGAIAGMEEEKKRAEEARRLEEVRLKAENDRRMREEVMFRTLKVSTDYLNAVCGFTQMQSEPSVQGFSDAVTALMGLGELCGKDEMTLIQMAILARPELMYHSVLRRYFRQTQDVKVGTLYLERFLTIPETAEELSHDHPTVVAAKQALGIAAESSGAKKNNQLAKFASLILFRFPGMPGTEHQGLKGLLLAVSRTGILKEESPKIPSLTKPNYNKPVVTPKSKIPGQKYASNKGAAEKVQAMILPGVTASLEDLASNNAAARAKANSKNKKKAA